MDTPAPTNPAVETVVAKAAETPKTIPAKSAAKTVVSILIIGGLIIGGIYIYRKIKNGRTEKSIRV
jgi:hypothetical protein